MPRISRGPDSDDPGSDVELEQQRGRPKRARHTCVADYHKFVHYFGDVSLQRRPAVRAGLLLSTRRAQ
jgi:hypothetical protein